MNRFVNKFDSQNQFEVLKNSYQQVEEAWNNKINLTGLKRKKISAVLVCGLGGSAISGDLLNDFLSARIKVPVIVNRGYNLPSFINKNWLIIISSYSGNTEETISCLRQALKLKASVISVSSGGKVERLSEKNSLPHIKLKAGFQPRYAFGMSFFTLLKILQELKLISAQDSTVKLVIKLWKAKGLAYSREDNFALDFAKKLIGFIPVIYSSESFSSAGYRFKCQLNENSKVHAFHHVIPEMNHNEIIGWETQKENLFNSKVIFFGDASDHPQIKKRYSILKELISSKGTEVLEVKSREKSKQVRIMDLIYLCDWISFYLAVLRGFDPSEIDFIHEMKKRLA